MDGDHLAAHLRLADAAGIVVVVARHSPARDLGRQQAARDLPVEELGAGIGRPQGTVGIENGKARLQAQHGRDELRGRGGQATGDERFWAHGVRRAYSSGVSTLATTAGSATATYVMCGWFSCSISRATAVAGARRNFSIISRPITMGCPWRPSYSGTAAQAGEARNASRRPAMVSGAAG